MKRFSFGRLGLYVYEIFLIMFTIFPFFWMISSSLKGTSEIFDTPPSLLPKAITFENYVNAITKHDILLYAGNSARVTLVTSLIVVVVASFAGYAIGFLNVKGSRAVESTMVAIQMFPLIVLIIPLFTLFRVMGILDSPYALVMANLAFTVPSSLILLKSYFAAVPTDLGEAASIDGANKFQTFYMILFPIVRPGIFAVGIYVCITVWQEFLLAVSLLANERLYTLPVGITTYIGENATDWGGLMATSVIISVPAIILFLSIQKQFIDNLAGSVKG